MVALVLVCECYVPFVYGWSVSVVPMKVFVVLGTGLEIRSEDC